MRNSTRTTALTPDRPLWNNARMKPLKNAKHEVFAQALVKGCTQTQAAIDAGYSPNCAEVTGSKLVSNTKIAERICELKEASADATIMTIAQRKQRLSEIAFAHLADYQILTPDGDNAIAYDKDSPHPGAVSELTEQIVVGTDEVQIRHKKIKLHSPIAAIQELNKMDGAHAPAKVHQTGNVILHIDSDDDDL